MAGPASSIAARRRLLWQGLSIEPEQRVDASGARYLGCKVEKISSKLAGGGRPATVVAYSTEEFS
eukprot:12088409-Alexandrium_andersonii.AAC.2